MFPGICCMKAGGGGCRMAVFCFGPFSSHRGKTKSDLHFFCCAAYAEKKTRFTLFKKKIRDLHKKKALSPHSEAVGSPRRGGGGVM